MAAARSGGAPEYEAINSDTDANLQISNLPANLELVRGGMLYVTEIYTKTPGDYAAGQVRRDGARHVVLDRVFLGRYARDTNMTRHRCDIGGEQGYALIYMTFILTVLLLFSGLAVDTGRAYVVRRS